MTDINGERSKLAAQGLVIRRREQWGSTFDYTNSRTVDAPAEDFFLHVAVVTDPGDLQGTEDEVARKIERIGVGRFPNTGGSYNALAFNTGRLYELQPLTRRGAHTVNDKHLSVCPHHGGRILTDRSGTDRYNLNYTVRALCLPQMPDDDVTNAQIDSAARWAAAQIRAGLAKPSAKWHGHRCVAFKDCPGAEGFARISELDDLTARYVRDGLTEEDELSTEDVQAIKAHIDARFNALVAAVEGVDESVWASQIADVYTPETGDTKSAATLLTHTATRTVARILADVQPLIVSDIVTNLRGQLPADVAAAVPNLEAIVEGVWSRQIADVYTPDSGDTAAAATILTHTANRVIDELKAENPEPPA